VADPERAPRVGDTVEYLRYSVDLTDRSRGTVTRVWREQHEPYATWCETEDQFMHFRWDGGEFFRVIEPPEDGGAGEGGL